MGRKKRKAPQRGDHFNMEQQEPESKKQRTMLLEPGDDDVKQDLSTCAGNNYHQFIFIFAQLMDAKKR